MHDRPADGDLAFDFTAEEEALAQVLYESLERLAPGFEDFTPWVGLLDGQKGVYCFAVKRLLSERDLLRRALAASGNG